MLPGVVGGDDRVRAGVRPLSRARTVLLAVAALVAVVGAGGAWYLAPVGPIATGYAAQVTCGGHVVADRPLDEAVADLPDNPLVPYLRVDADGPVVTATLLGAYASTSVRTADGGCRLVDPDDGPDVAELAATDGELLGPPAQSLPADDLVVPTSVRTEAANAGFDLALLDAALTGAFAEDADPATEVGTRAVVVVHQGTVVAERYADGFDADTPLLGWSMTKSVANALAGRLVEQGLLDVSRAEVWPQWPADDPRRAVTVEQLLRMTSGLAFEEVYDPDTDATRMLFTPLDTAAYAADKPLAHEPGTHWSYSSGATNLLCDLLARVAGSDPARVVAQEVFGPLRMTSAVLGTDAGGDPVCSSFGYATARDWARFGLLYEQDGVWGPRRLLPEGWVAWSTAPVDLGDAGPGPTPYGAGFWLNAGPRGSNGRPASVRMPSVPLDAFWASGNEGQHVVVLPTQDLVVVRLGLTRGHDGLDWGLEPLLAGIVAALEGDG